MEEFKKFEGLTNTIGVSIKSSTKSGGRYDAYSKLIEVPLIETKDHRLMICAHELGHAIQSPKEFETPYGHLTDADRAYYVVTVEEDAWVKGEAILRKLYPNLSDDFWLDYEVFKNENLGSYIREFNVCASLFPSYYKFLNHYHANIKPMCLKSFTYNLEN